MARADLLKRLFASHSRREDEAFREAAEEIVAEERKKHHIVLANELQRLLSNGIEKERSPGLMRLDPLPMDSDRRTPLISIRSPERYLDDLILDERVRRWVARLMEEFRSWDILEANGLQPIRRVLFCGPSGCGKTATAEAIASELGLPLLYARFDSVVSSLLGETAANLRKVFDYAARGQWVLLFDEFDAIGRSRDDATEHGEIKRLVNSFLQILDGFQGHSLIIAATNFEEALDPAIWRRFDEVLRFERPSDTAIESLLRKRLRTLEARDEQVKQLTGELSGSTFADGERIALDLRRSAAIRGSRRLEDQDLEQAVERFRYRKKTIQKVSAHGAPPHVDED